ncbi:MAG: pyruvate kinase [Eubacteriales bacterium]|jgi:pyruvate kinase|nr:pyruvate kinase [Eubacteriales bacterium]MDD3109821.1 pyruvate kinase [Eubacteriales bacterium]MDD3572536.1 pyruvate kinase [Eubacteriales bacterium]MDD4134082.1 pyruvate kinase [Eubacteriales bacterium]NLO13977.1 pyruvate kinase [Clostridiales bacterium]
MRKTKIICTLGPASSTRETIRAMIEAGMNVARFNFSHGTHESHLATYLELNKVRNDLGVSVATILDTKGPEVRVGTFREGGITLKAGEFFDLVTFEAEGDQNQVSLSYARLPHELGESRRILLDDGLIELEALEVSDERIHTRVVIGGELSNRKGVNIPGARLSIPYMSDRDKEDILFGIRTGFDIVAASFVRKLEDVKMMRDFLDENGGGHVRVMAKIENAEGVANLEEIIKVCDSVMIARGDLGVEIPFEEIPVIQKRIIKVASMAGKQVVTATQMLESMVHHSRPTRAEITDVANAIYDGTSVIMLSGETASGKYPVEAVRTMVRIALRTERDINYKRRFFVDNMYQDAHNITDAVSHAACLIAYNLSANAIITVTKSGTTAYMLSRFRSDIPIIACTPDSTTWRQMSLSWGVTGVMVGEEKVMEVLFDQAINSAKQAGLVKGGDLVVLTAGVPLSQAGGTNLIKVSYVPD